MKPWIGRIIFAILILCGLSDQSVPVMAGDQGAGVSAEEKEARRQEWMHLKWEKLIARARAQQQQIERWQDTRVKRLRAQRRKALFQKRRQIAAELSR